jgi:hypothetical protein
MCNQNWQVHLTDLNQARLCALRPMPLLNSVEQLEKKGALGTVSEQ